MCVLWYFPTRAMYLYSAYTYILQAKLRRPRRNSFVAAMLPPPPPRTDASPNVLVRPLLKYVVGDLSETKFYFEIIDPNVFTAYCSFVLWTG